MVKKIRENVPYLLIALYLFKWNVIVVESKNVYLLSFTKIMTVIFIAILVKASYKLAVFGYKKAKLLQW